MIAPTSFFLDYGCHIRILEEAYWSPRATQVHRLGYQKAQAGRFADPLTLTPFYLRGPQVTLRKPRPKSSPAPGVNDATPGEPAS